MYATWLSWRTPMRIIVVHYMEILLQWNYVRILRLWFIGFLRNELPLYWDYNIQLILILSSTCTGKKANCYPTACNCKQHYKQLLFSVKHCIITGGFAKIKTRLDTKKKGKKPSPPDQPSCSASSALFATNWSPFSSGSLTLGHSAVNTEKVHVWHVLHLQWYTQGATTSLKLPPCLLVGLYAHFLLVRFVSVVHCKSAGFKYLCFFRGKRDVEAYEHFPLQWYREVRRIKKSTQNSPGCVRYDFYTCNHFSTHVHFPVIKHCYIPSCRVFIHSTDAMRS